MDVPMASGSSLLEPAFWFAIDQGHYQFQQRPQNLSKKKSAILPIVPRQIVRAGSQKQYSECANENLNPQRIQAGLDCSVGTKRKNDADAEHLKRVLAALDQRRGQAPLQNWRIRCQEPGDDDGDSNEMHYAVGREIGLVVGVERFQNPMRKKIAKAGGVSSHRHHQGKDNKRGRKIEHGPRSNHRLHGVSAAKRYPGAEEKQQLPRERIEIPKAGWRGRK